MNDICVPLPRFEAAKSAHVEVRIENQRKNCNYRVEAFICFPEEQLKNSLTKSHKSEDTIQLLKSSIESHDKNWELVQIYNPGPPGEFIQVLFREKIKMLFPTAPGAN